VLTVYTGDCSNLVEIGCNDDCPGDLDDPCTGPDSCVTFDAVEGETYMIRIAGNASHGDLTNR